MARDRSDGGGFICVWRSFRKHQHYFANERRKATNQDAHLDLWLSASYADEDIFSQGETVHIERGQILTAVIALAERWRWSRTRVERFLTAAELRGELVQKRGNRRTILTICNYDKWQNVRSLNESPAEQLTSSRKAPEKHVEQSEPSEPANHQNGRPYVTESLGNGGNGNGRNRAEMSDDRELQAIKVVAHCQHTAERVVHHKLADLDAVPKMRKLLTVRDAETVSEVFDHFAVTRRKPSTFNFHNFFAYYTEHEQETINDLPEEEP